MSAIEPEFEVAQTFEGTIPYEKSYFPLLAIAAISIIVIMMAIKK